MADLIAQTPLEALLPLTEGATSLIETTPAFITSVSPSNGKEKQLNAAIKADHALDLPGIGCVTQNGDLRMLWTGQGVYFLVGDQPGAASLAESAALTDQSDGWAVMELQGKDAAAVMARVCPLDLRASQFKRGYTARTAVAQLTAVVSIRPKGFEIMVMRSYGQSAVHHIHDAMVSVAAQKSR